MLTYLLEVKIIEYLRVVPNGTVIAQINIARNTSSVSRRVFNVLVECSSNKLRKTNGAIEVK